jgi:hypothetical protein
MQTKSPSLSNVGRVGAQTWAQDFEQRHGRIDHAPTLRVIQMDERQAPDAENGYLRRAMGSIDFELFVCALIYFRSSGMSDRKCREVQNILGGAMSRRTYWNNLDRLWYFMAGRMIERPISAPYRNALPSAAQRYAGKEPIVQNPTE